MTLSQKIVFSFFLVLASVVLGKKTKLLLINISCMEQIIKNKIQSVLNVKEKEFPFHLNDSVFPINP